MKIILSFLAFIVLSACSSKLDKKSIKTAFEDSIDESINISDFTVITVERANENKEVYNVLFSAKYSVEDSLNFWKGDVFKIDKGELRILRTYSGDWWVESKRYSPKRIDYGQESKMINKEFVGILNNHIPCTLILSSDGEELTGTLSYLKFNHEIVGRVIDTGLHIVEIHSKTMLADNRLSYNGSIYDLKKVKGKFIGKGYTQDGETLYLNVERK